MARLAHAFRRAFAAGLFSILAAAPAARAGTCQLALVLAHDVSSSVSKYEYDLQTSGHAAAFRHPEIQKEILAMGEIQVMLVHWSADYYQERRTPWRTLREVADIKAFAEESGALERLHDNGATAIGDMLAWLTGVWTEPEPAPCLRRVIDVSGDGASNSGRALAPARARILAEKVTINGLVFDKSEPDEKPPLPHYKSKVIGGPGAFVMKVDRLEDYGRAFHQKLLRELRGPPLAELRGPASSRLTVAAP